MMTVMAKPFAGTLPKLDTFSEVVVGATEVIDSAESLPVGGIVVASPATMLARVTAGGALGVVAGWVVRMSTTGTPAAAAMRKQAQQNLAPAWMEDMSVITRVSLRSWFVS